MTATMEAPPRADYAAQNNIPLDLIDTSPLNPRVDFDADKLRSLANDIQMRGVLQPILVRSVGDRYEILAGERRYRACLLAEEVTIPAIVRECTDEQAVEIAIVENFQRHDLNPMELARGISKLSEFGMTQVAIAERLGKQQGDVSKLLGLLRLPEITRNAIAAGRLTQTHGVYLSALLEWPTEIERLSDLATHEEWTTDRLKAAVDTCRRAEEDKRGQVRMFDDPPAPPTEAERKAGAAVAGFFSAPGGGDAGNRTDGTNGTNTATAPPFGPPAGTVSTTDRVTETHTTVTTPSKPEAPNGTDRPNPAPASTVPAPAVATAPTVPAASPAANTAPPPSGAMVNCLIPESLSDWLWDNDLTAITALELLRRMQTALEASGRPGDLKQYIDGLDTLPPIGAAAADDDGRDLSIYDPPAIIEEDDTDE